MHWIIKVLILTAVVAVAVIWTVRKIRYGSSCCGDHEPPPPKVRPADRDVRNYPYIYELEVDGMHCANCARRVENAFNSGTGLWAEADISNNKVRLLSKSSISERECSKIVSGAGYTLLKLSIIKEQEI
ncbi:Heavy-metal-associated domain-containing protein [Ruminococcaceae bacterium YRB3002]|nr:Heavy-metal-associated domain-containing protein [Ruminococcaceae bacterium YRB3002]